LPGVKDVVPAFASVTIYYDIAQTGAYLSFETRVLEIATRGADLAPRASAARVVEIPVCYGGAHGPDLEELSSRAGVPVEQAIEWHAEAAYQVHAIGFVPGFAYLGGLPRKLHTPRRATPRASVAPGSVGIGGGLTGVYPVATPGGWNIIGRTPLVMFAVERVEPALLHAGDRVKFRPISAEEFAAWK
jgi:inhibitor of KinA